MPAICRGDSHTPFPLPPAARHCPRCGAPADAAIADLPGQRSTLSARIELDGLRGGPRWHGAAPAERPVFVHESGRLLKTRAANGLAHKLTAEEFPLPPGGAGRLLGITSHPETSPWGLVSWERALYIIHGGTRPPACVWRPTGDERLVFPASLLARRTPGGADRGLTALLPVVSVSCGPTLQAVRLDPRGFSQGHGAARYEPCPGATPAFSSRITEKGRGIFVTPALPDARSTAVVVVAVEHGGAAELKVLELTLTPPDGFDLAAAPLRTPALLGQQPSCGRFHAGAGGSRWFFWVGAEEGRGLVEWQIFDLRRTPGSEFNGFHLGRISEGSFTLPGPLAVIASGSEGSAKPLWTNDAGRVFAMGSGGPMTPGVGNDLPVSPIFALAHAGDRWFQFPEQVHALYGPEPSSAVWGVNTARSLLVRVTASGGLMDGHEVRTGSGELSIRDLKLVSDPVLADGAVFALRARDQDGAGRTTFHLEVCA